jgi:hypothetical protein
MTRKLSLADLNDRIAKAEIRLAKVKAELGQLKVRRRAIVAGTESGSARRNPARDELIRKKYNELKALYGGVAALADEFKLSRRQLHRIVKTVT